MSDERAHDTASESKTSDGNLAAPDVANDEGSENDPVFTQEQQHLSDTYATLRSMAARLRSRCARTRTRLPPQNSRWWRKSSRTTAATRKPSRPTPTSPP